VDGDTHQHRVSSQSVSAPEGDRCPITAARPQGADARLLELGDIDLPGAGGHMPAKDGGERGTLSPAWTTHRT
jgi:hypothetical protein